MKRAFMGVIHGGSYEDGSESRGDAIVCSDEESSTGETESLYQLQDGRIGGCSDGDSILDPSDLPNRVGIFMAGTQAALHSSTAVATTSGSAAATAAGAGGPVRPPAQVLSELFDALVVLMAEVNPVDHDVHNAEIAKIKEQITQAKADLAAEDTRMATERGTHTSLQAHVGPERVAGSHEEEVPIPFASGFRGQRPFQHPRSRNQ